MTALAAPTAATIGAAVGTTAVAAGTAATTGAATKVLIDKL
jgi:hypothetical protein